MSYEHSYKPGELVIHKHWHIVGRVDFVYRHIDFAGKVFYTYMVSFGQHGKAYDPQKVAVCVMLPEFELSPYQHETT